MKLLMFLLTVMLSFCQLRAAAPPYMIIPFKQDPPISIDGELEDWKDVPVKITLESKTDQLRLQRKFSGNFSAEIKLCWKPEGLFIAVEAKDDIFLQPGTGLSLFDGDHVELFIDTVPEGNGTVASFGKGQFHIGISPGNFKDLTPEIYCAFPLNKKLSNTRCASRKTAGGWIVEAFIPWSSLDRPPILLHSVIGLNVWVCNAVRNEGNRVAPDCILTTGKADAKFRNRIDLKRAVFADAEGRTKTVIRLNKSIKLAEKIILGPQETQEIVFDRPVHPAYLVPVLRLRANIVSKNEFEGYAQIMMLKLNKSDYFSGAELVIPENEYLTPSGTQDCIFKTGSGFLVPYTKNGKAGALRKYTRRFFKKHYDMHSFAFNILPGLKDGKNVLLLKNNFTKKFKYSLELSDIRIDFEPVSILKKRRSAPTGDLPLIAPREIKPFSAKVVMKDNQISFTSPQGTSRVVSRFSTPDGKWATGSCKYFTHTRSIEKKTELLIVKDTFTNLTRKNLPIIQQHTVIPAGKDTRLYACGIESASTADVVRSDGNYSVFSDSKGFGIGLFPLNVEFQLHSGAFIPAPGHIMLTDDQLVLPPGGKITQEFAAVPVAEGGYYAFVNIVRRHLKANVTVNGPSGSINCEGWFDPYMPRLNSLNIQRAGLGEGIGIAFLTSPRIPREKRRIAQIRKIRPQAKISRYYHSQLETTPTQQYPDRERVLLKNGKQALYGGSNCRIFLTLEGGEYAKLLEKALDDFLTNWDIDAIYWDELNYSGVPYHYGEPWDKCSGDIDPRTHEITRLKSSVFLIQRPWKNRMVDKILASGKNVGANGGSARMGEFAQKIVSTFTETERDSNNARVHFTTPLSHINCNGQMSMRDLHRRFLVSLDYAVLSNFSTLSVPRSNDFYPCIPCLCYPSTPIELREGCLIAKERIVTKVSGAYTWNDTSKHEVHIFDHDGIEVPNTMKTVSRNGKTVTELRLPEDWSAVIIRK